MKIEPMSIEKIKEFVHSCASCQFPDCKDCPEGLSIALAWAHAEARARYWEMDRHTKYTPTLEDCLAEVLREIGCPEDQNA